MEEGENTVSASTLRPHTPQNQSRIGRILLSHGAVIKSAHTTYWANHPKAVCIFEKYRDGLDKFMEGEYIAIHNLLFGQITNKNF